MPNFYIYYFLLPLYENSGLDANQYLFTENKLMKEQATSFHKISTAIKAR